MLLSGTKTKQQGFCTHSGENKPFFSKTHTIAAKVKRGAGGGPAQTGRVRLKRQNGNGPELNSEHQ